MHCKTNNVLYRALLHWEQFSQCGVYKLGMVWKSAVHDPQRVLFCLDLTSVLTDHYIILIWLCVCVCVCVCVFVCVCVCVWVCVNSHSLLQWMFFCYEGSVAVISRYSVSTHICRLASHDWASILQKTEKSNKKRYDKFHYHGTKHYHVNFSSWSYICIGERRSVAPGPPRADTLTVYFLLETSE